MQGYNPLIGFKNIKLKFEIEIFMFSEGFEYFGPQIRTPRKKTVYMTGWKRVETPNSVNNSPNLVLNKFFLNPISGLIKVT